MENSDFGQLFKFTAEDLASNRQGQLSPAQQARWAEARQWSGSVMKTAVPLITTAIITIIGVVISFILRQPVVGVIISLIIAGAVGSVMSKRAKQTGQNEASVPVTAVGRVEGIASLKETLDSDEHHLTRRFRLEIEQYSFQLFRKEQFEALKNGARYAVYYLDDDTRYIVSLEKMN